MKRTLVVAAYSPELDGLAERLREPIAGGLITTRAIGIGLVEASAGIERALAEIRPERLVLVGTAGRLPSSPLELKQVAVVSGAYLVVREPEYLPGLMRQKADADVLLATAFGKALGAPLVEVASTLGITLSDSEAERLATQGPAQLEQLECFAVLAAALRHQLPATAVLAVANRVGAEGANEWRRHRADAERAAVDAVARALG